MLLIDGVMYGSAERDSVESLTDLSFDFDSRHNIIIHVYKRSPSDVNDRTLVGCIEIPPCNGRELVAYLSMMSPYGAGK